MASIAMASNRPALAVVPEEPAVATPSRIEQIRAKALQLFAERGFAQVSMRELALHSGITAGALYHHFVSKEQLLFELIEEFYDDLHAMFAQSETGTPMQRLQALVQAHIALHERRRLHFLMAEQEFRCLDAAHQQQILLLRGSYEDKFLQHLQAAGATAPTATLKACVQGLVVWLNSLPSSSVHCALSGEQRRALIGAMALGALSAVLGPQCVAMTYPSGAAARH